MGLYLVLVDQIAVCIRYVNPPNYPSTADMEVSIAGDKGFKDHPSGIDL